MSQTLEGAEKKSTNATRSVARDAAEFVVGSTWGHRARGGAMPVEVVAIDGDRLVYRDLRDGYVNSYGLRRACQPSAFWPIAREVPVGQRVEIPAARPAPPVEPEPEPATPSTALVSRQVDGWTLFDGAGSTWVRDIDLAERAGLAKPRNIRAVIATAIKDGSLSIALPAGDARAPGFCEVDELVQIGNGAARSVSTYYLNQEGALLVLTRLRTPKAIEVTKAVVTVFAAAMRGEVCAAPAGLDRLAAIMERQLADSAKRMDAIEGALLRLAADGGRRSVEPLPSPVVDLIPKDWRSSATIADIVTARFKATTGQTVTKHQVDVIIAASGVRSNATLARTRRVVRGEDEATRIDVPQWMYAPPVHDMVYGAIRPLSASKQEPLPGVNGSGSGAPS